MAKSLKNKLLISIVLLILTIGAVLGYAFINANQLIAGFKPQLEDKISKLLNTNVKLGEIHVSIFPETAFKISSLELGQANKNISGPKFDELLIKLDLPQLLQSKLAITEVLIKAPKAKFTKLPEDTTASKTESQKTSATKADNTETAKNLSSPLEINLQSFKIEDGRFEFEDGNKKYHISDLNISSGLYVQGDQVQLQKLDLALLAMDKIPFSISVPSLNFVANKINIAEFLTKLAEQQISGNADFDLNSKSGDIKIASDGLDLVALLAAARHIQPDLPALEIKGQIAPDIKANISASDFKASGSIDLKNISVSQAQFTGSEINGKVTLHAATPDTAEAQSSDLTFKLNEQPGKLAFKFKHQDKQINISDLNLNFLGGNLQSALDLTLDSKAFSSKTTASNLQIASILSLLKKSDLPLTGNVTQFSSNLQGTLNEKPINSLRGQVQLSVADGALKGFNIAGVVLKAVNNLPFLTGSLYSSLPSSQQAAFDSSDTAFSSFTSNLNLAGQGISVQSMNLVSPTFTVDAKGTVGFDSNLALKATIYFSQAFSSTLVASSANLKYGLDDQGRLALPLTISGIAPSVTILPDLQKLAEGSGKKILQEKAAEAATEFLKKKGLNSLFGF